jgi:hypothetical protein
LPIGFDELYVAVNEKVLTQPKGDPKSSTTGVKNPATARKEAGRIATARKKAKGGGGAK